MTPAAPDSFAPYGADAVAALRALPPLSPPGERAAAVADALGVRDLAPATTVRESAPVRQGRVDVVRLSWETGFGPTTQAWLATPAGARAADLPGVLAFHAHGGVRTVGARVLVDDGEAAESRLAEVRDAHYAGRTPVNDLAARGFAVLVHDAFSWGSRRLDHADVAPADYDRVSNRRERDLVIWASLLGTSLAGLVAQDDLVALDVLAARTAGPLGAFGLSGGGARVVHLVALDAPLDAAVASCAVAPWSSMAPTTPRATRASTCPRASPASPTSPTCCAQPGVGRRCSPSSRRTTSFSRTRACARRTRGWRRTAPATAVAGTWDAATTRGTS
ncbi:hypothetical protein [Paraoerskovia sediminicola]|nr:hypothetical protein [Paraoerskovia sediminicola]